MLHLPSTFKSRGYLFEQVKRENNIAIFKRTGLLGKDDKPVGAVGYEVIRINRHNGYPLGDNYVKPAEVYPGASAWGKLALSAPSLEIAEKQFLRFQEKFAGKDNLTGPVKDEAIADCDAMGSKEPSHVAAERTGGRGRKALNIEIVLPNKEEFCLKDAEEANKEKKVSGGYIYLRLKELEKANKIVFSGKRKVSEGRGKPTTFYKKVKP